ncbi:MAG: DUF302 domain-containing protein [Gemmatirosa sp.]
MLDHQLQYGFGATVALPFPEALERTREALIVEGFGVLCEINLEATMRQRLGVEMGPYAILGACNPPLAHEALTVDPDVGLLLPCNVVVYAGTDPGSCVVAALAPTAALAIANNTALTPIAAQAEQRLRRAMERVAASTPAPSPNAVEVLDEIC